MNIEKLIFENLLFNQNYNRKVIAHLKNEYFENKTIFDLIYSFFLKYNNFPTKEALKLDLDEVSNLNQDQYKSSIELIDSLKQDDEINTDYLLDKTEEFCKNKALYNALHQAIKIANDDEEKDQLAKGSIPKILSDALAVSFDTQLGLDYLEMSDELFAYYHQTTKRIPFHIDLLNKITKGGVGPGTLTVPLAPTGVGKSLHLCDNAADNLAKGYSVMYFTLEMSEEETAKRIDANLIDVPVNELELLSKQEYDKKRKKIKEMYSGRLVIKQYPTGGASVNNFRYFLNELKLKKNFKPDIIYVDYLNICMSSRYKFGANMNSYNYVKAIAEELRGLGIEFKVPVIAPTQTNRSGASNSDFDLTDISDSFGVAMTGDLSYGLITSAELREQKQIMFKQLKNRYNDLNYYNKFVVGVDYSKMRFFDIDKSDDQEIVDSAVFDKTSFGEEKKISKDMFKKFII